MAIDPNDGLWQYQTFDDAKGMVNTQAKLKAFSLPDLKGKRFLEAGCNEGFYCGYALDQGAARVVGLDAMDGYIKRAAKRFPQAEFFSQTWDTLPEGPFDVILFASAMHYIPTTEGLLGLLKRMKACLAPEGVIVIECGVLPDYQKDEVYEAFERNDGSVVRYPSLRLFSRLCDEAGLTHRRIGVSEPGDGIDRLVFHCCHKENSAAGFSTETNEKATNSNDGLFQYQTFDDAKGMVNTQAKLKAFSLPDLKGKRFLEAGCNEGFYCGYALDQGAARVVGLDATNGYIMRAAKRFPQAEFFSQTWDTLPEGPFDVILFASAMHYIPTTEGLLGLLKRMKACLAPEGVIIIECGVLPDYQREKVYEAFERKDGSVVHYPSLRLFSGLCDEAGLTHRMIGVSEPGDGIDRLVFHCRAKKPMALFVIGKPGEGKSVFSSALAWTIKENLIRVDFEMMKLYEREYAHLKHTDYMTVNSLCSIVNDRKEKGVEEIAAYLHERILETLKVIKSGPIIVEGIVPDLWEYQAVYNKLLSLLADQFIVWQCERGAPFPDLTESAAA